MTNVRHTLRFLDPQVVHAAAVFTLAIGLGANIWACYLPARRATRVPAMTALRHE